MKYVIEPLGPQHDRGAFCCGNDAVDEFCKEAHKDHAAYKKRVFVALEPGKLDVVGYYALAITTIGAGKAKRYSDPAIQIEMLGVRKDDQGKGVGKALISHALSKVYGVAQAAGTIWVWLTAADRQVADFYLKLGFDWLDEKRLTMYLPIEDVIALVEGK